MGNVVLHVMLLESQTPRIDLHVVRDELLEVMQRPRAKPDTGQVQKFSWVSEGVGCFLVTVCFGIAADSDVVQVLQSNARRIEARLNAQYREAPEVLMAIQSLLGDGERQLPIDEYGRRAVSVEQV
jgi:hypothetical protein